MVRATHTHTHTRPARSRRCVTLILTLSPIAHPERAHLVVDVGVLVLLQPLELVYPLCLVEGPGELVLALGLAQLLAGREQETVFAKVRIESYSSH